jgi:hypothetical protein
MKVTEASSFRARLFTAMECRKSTSFLTWLESVPRTFENWEQIIYYDDTKVSKCISIGNEFLKYHQTMCDSVSISIVH